VSKPWIADYLFLITNAEFCNQIDSLDFPLVDMVELVKILGKD
jgi:hypothetical protein